MGWDGLVYTGTLFGQTVGRGVHGAGGVDSGPAQVGPVERTSFMPFRAGWRSHYQACLGDRRQGLGTR